MAMALGVGATMADELVAARFRAATICGAYSNTVVLIRCAPAG
jgi:hypothetical protein